MKKLRLLPILVFFILAGLTSTACYLDFGRDSPRYAPTAEHTLNTPEIFFRENTANGELGWNNSPPGNLPTIALRATANGITQDISIPYTGNLLNLTALEELQTADYYDVSIMFKGFEVGRERRTDGRPDHIFHDSGWSNTITFHRVINSPTPKNLRLVGGGVNNFRVAFEVEHIGGFFTMVQLSITDSGGNTVSTHESQGNHVDGTVTAHAPVGAMLNEEYTITAKARFVWNNPIAERDFGHGRTIAAEAAQSQPITVTRRHLDLPVITQATISSIRWEPIEGVENYTVRVFRMNEFRFTFEQINTTITGTEFNFEAYVEGRGWDWQTWNSWGESFEEDYFIFYIRPRGAMVIENTLYLEPPLFPLANIATNPNVHKLYLPPPGSS